MLRNHESLFFNGAVMSQIKRRISLLIVNAYAITIIFNTLLKFFIHQTYNLEWLLKDCSHFRLFNGMLQTKMGKMAV